MDNLELNIDFLLNAPEAKAEAKAIEKEIEGVADTAEKSAKRVQQNIDSIVEDTKKNVRKGVEEVEKLNKSTQNVPSNKGSSNTNSNQNYNTNKSLLDSLNEQLNTAKKQANEAIDKGTLANANSKIQQYENEIKRLSNVGKKGFDELGNAIQKNEGVLGKLWAKVYQVANILPGLGVAGLIAFATEPIIAYISQLDIFKHKATEAELAAEAMTKALTEGGYAKAISNINELKININLAKEGLYDKTAVIENYNKSIGATAGQVKTLGEVEQGIAKNADDFIKMTLYKAIAMETLQESAKKSVDAIKERNKTDIEALSDFDKLQALILKTAYNLPIDFVSYSNIAKKNKEKKAKELEDEKASLDKIANDYQKKAAEIAKKMGGVLGSDSSTKVDNSYVDRAESLQRQIFEIQNEYSRKRMSKDEEELQAVRDRFGKLQADIVKFNKDPKNKLKVDGSGLDETKQKAIDDLKYKQETEKLKVNLTEQKGLYAEYEEYKKIVGEQKAKERYAKELDTEKTYLQSLQAETAKLEGRNDLNAREKDRLEELNKLIKQAKAEQQKQDDERLKVALEAAKTYADKVLSIEKKFSDERKVLRDAGELTADREVELEKAKKLALDAAKDEALQKTAIYKKLAEDIVQVSRKQIVAEIEVIKDALRESGLSEELQKSLEDNLAKLEGALQNGAENNYLQKLRERYADLQKELESSENGKSIISEKEKARILKALTDVKAKINEIDKNTDGKITWGDKVAKQFEYLKGTSQEVAEGLARDFGQLSGVFDSLSSSVGGTDSGIGRATKSLADMLKVASQANQAIASFGAGDIVGGITGITGIASFVISGIQQADKAYRDFYQNAYEGEKKYQDLIRQRAIDEASNDSLKYRSLLEQAKLQTKNVADYKKESDEIFAKLQSLYYTKDIAKTSILGIIPTGSTKLIDTLAGKSFEELQKLLLQGKLEDEAKTLVERLVELEKAGYDAQKALAELSQQLAELFTGTTADNLADSLTQMFREGKTSVQDFADFFEETMQEAALSIFKNKILAEETAKFYDSFTNAVKDGELTKNEKDSLQALYAALTEEAKKQFEALKATTGIDFSNTASSSTSMVGTIQRSLTEQTGSELVGLQRNMYDQTKKGNAIAVDTLSSIRESATTLKNIESNTAKTVETLKDAVNELKDINKNTKPTGAYDRGW